MTQVEAAKVSVQESAPEVVLQRTVLPDDADFDTLPLYVESGVVRPLPERTRRETNTMPEPATPVGHEVHPDLVLGRHSLRVPAGTRASFATYFNAFPASYWRRWTSVTDVTLRVQVSGEADVIVYRSNVRGDQNRVTSARGGTGGTGTVVINRW